MARALLPLLLIAFDIFCLIDVITSDEDRVRRLPKIAWFLLILIIPVIGSFLWLFLGRPPTELAAGGPTAPAHPTGPHPSPGPGPIAPTPESDQEFQQRIRARAEEQRRRYAEQQRRERGEA
jgi:hypothetical protein